jgi:hypothetical protein
MTIAPQPASALPTVTQAEQDGLSAKRSLGGQLLLWLGLIVAIGIPTYYVTHYFFENHILADAEYYFSYWREAKRTPGGLENLRALNSDQILKLGSKDPGYTVLIWSATRFSWTRSEFLALVNAIAATLSVSLFYRKFSSLFFAYPLLIYSYYLPALMLTPERFRFSVYFAGLAMVLWVRNRRLLASVVGVFALLVHAQALLFYIAIGVYIYFPLIREAFFAIIRTGVIRRWVWWFAGASIGAGLWVVSVNPQIQYKLSLYITNRIDAKAYLLVVLLFAARFVVGRPGPFLTAATITLVASFIAVGTYFSRTLVNIYILYLLDFLSVPKKRFVMWLTLGALTYWTYGKTMGFYGSILAGDGGYR